LLTRAADGTMDLQYQEQEGRGDVQYLGRVTDKRIARFIWLGYLGGKKVSSEPARKSVVDGVMELVERPVGTVETRVV